MANDRDQWWPCADWLLRCLSDLPDIQHHAMEILTGEEATVSSLLTSLQDGVLLCYILPAISGGRVDLKSLEGFKVMTLNSAFVFKKNINIFLNQCSSYFKLKKSELFEADDLIGQENISGILQCLSILSRSQRAIQSGIPGFQLPSADDTEYYCPPELYRPQADDTVYSIEYTQNEKLYETLIERPCRPLEKRQSGLTKKQMCQQEFVETESHYVDTLRDLHDEVYRRMLEDCSRPDGRVKSAWSRDEVEEIFKFIPDLLELHQNILQEMQITIMLKSDESESLPEVLLRYKRELLIYGKYCVHMQKSQKLVENGCRCDKAKSAELQRLLDQNEAKFKLTEYLTLPIQRVLKYHLLIDTLKRIEENSGSHRLPQLQDAHSAMLEVASYVNEVKRDIERTALIDQIQNNIEDLELPANMRLINYGRLQYDGELKIIGGKSRYCFLLNRLFMIVKSKGQGRDGYVFKDVFGIESVTTFEEIEQSGSNKKWGGKWSWGFKVTPQGERSFQFLAKTAELRRQWLDAFQRAMDERFPPNYNNFGHNFEPCTFDEPTHCDNCKQLLLGCFLQGYKCKNTGMRTHRDCIPQEAGPLDWTDGRMPIGFVGKMSHDEARDSLLGQPAGTFLVRMSANAGLVISLSYRGAVKHMIIRSKEGCHYLGEVRKFPDRHSLVLHYMKNSLNECFTDLDTALLQPYSPRASQRSASISTSTPKQASVLSAGIAIRSCRDSCGQFSLQQGERVSLLEQRNGLWRCRKSNGQVGQLPLDALRPVSYGQGAQ